MRKPGEGRTMTDTAIDMTAARIETTQETTKNYTDGERYNQDAPARGRAILALANASAESSPTML
jgi:hypothetical protein